MFVTSNFSIAEIKQSHIELFLYRLAHFFLSELIIELMRQCFSSIETLLGRVNHDLVDEIEQERVSLGKDLPPFPTFYLRELVVIQVVLWVHLDYLCLGGRA